MIGVRRVITASAGDPPSEIPFTMRAGKRYRLTAVDGAIHYKIVVPGEDAATSGDPELQQGESVIVKAEGPARRISVLGPSSAAVEVQLVAFGYGLTRRRLTTLDVQIVASDDPVGTNAAFAYTVTVTNAGSDVAWEINLELTLDEITEYVSASGDGWTLSEDGGEVTGRLAALAPGASSIVTVNVTTGDDEGTATVTATVVAENAPEASDSEETVVESLPSIGVGISDTADPVITGGDAFAYEVVVTNDGDVDVEDVEVTIALDASLSYVSASGTGWSISEDSGVVTATRATLSPGAGPTITINVTTGDSAVTASTSVVASASNADAPANDTETTEVELVTKDAVGLRYFPANAAEWARFIARKGLTIAVPDNLHLCQEASGNLADSIGSLTLTANNTPAYQVAVTGMARKGVKGDANTANQRFLSTGGPDASMTSFARLAWIEVGTLDTLGRDILGNGGSADVSVQALTVGGVPTIRYREGSNIADSTNAGYAGAVMPILLVVNHTTSAARLYTPLAKMSPTFGAPANSTNTFIGAQSGTWADVTVFYECQWVGSNGEISEAQAEALFEALLGTAMPWGS